MVQNCAGLPLAINVLGGLLSTKQHTVYEWEKLHRNVKTYAGKGKVHGGEQWIYPELSWVLGLSYDDLPYHLKSCFLHLAHFPVDYVIRVKELCRIWAAEGFVGFRLKGDSGNTAEGIAYDCLNELVERYMVQVIQRSSTGRIKTCNINLVMRDLCLSKAAELNFVEIIDFHNRDEAHLTGIARRLAVYMDDDANQLLTLINSVRRGNVRSLICFNTPLTRCDQALKPLFNSFPLLKVLKFGNLGRVKVPKEIGRLFHLRFLSFKGSHVENLPSSIANLRCLQTLDLRTELRLEFPNVKWKSEQLEHIYLPRDTYSVHDTSLWLANPGCLRTLVNISTDRFSLKNFSELINLTKLDLRLCRSSDNLEEIFGHKAIKFDRLCSLSVYIELEFLVDITPIILGCPRMLKLSIHGKILKLPEDVPQSLIKLTLHNTSLQVDPMAGLEKLQNLKVLHLESVDLMGNGMICSKGGFPQLESLSFCHVYNFDGWRMEEGALPRLYRLQIENCSDLEILPDGLRYVETLHDISIKEMSSNFIMRIMKGGEDFYKVLHVPVIVFDSSLSDLSTP
ncbi:NB-ARC domain, LRR domain containing protein [Trema orientale]|uniref:NB-ARC domain, LRR domain containing protein n=1 Tax=Trema orientale TaxID=63057 RepID=A0A2P5FUG2_TREOI|nr:NB-ARC domain, LRR domain containing protein [Trema orientale]